MTNGSGCGSVRPKNIQIPRIRIPNTARMVWGVPRSLNSSDSENAGGEEAADQARTEHGRRRSKVTTSNLRYIFFFTYFRPLSSEMDPAGNRLIRKVVIKERGAEGFLEKSARFQFS
jgi:hypothetical protein